MSWQIEIADAAHEDLRDIYAYIAYELRSPENARNVLRRILNGIATLEEMPNRFRPYPREPLASKGVRVMDVGNFCVYYLAKDGVVAVSRILYFRRDAASVIAESELQIDVEYGLEAKAALSNTRATLNV